MKKKTKKTIFWIILIASILVLIGVIIYGGQHKWFQFIINVPSQNVSLTPSETAPIYSSCNQVCSVQGYSKYYNFINACKPGEYKVTYGYSNQAPLLICCCYNEETPAIACIDSDGDNRDTPGHVTYGDVYTDKCLDVGQAVTEYICNADGRVASKNEACDYGEVCIQSRSGGYCKKSTPTWKPGDTVFSGSGTGTLIGTNEISSIDLSEYGITTGGNCQLGAQIQTSWSYDNPSLCTGVWGMEGIKWDFYDSNGLEYTRLDASPLALGIDLHPTEHYLEWNGQTAWKGMVTKMPNVLPNCIINYEYSVRIYIYSCS